MIKELAAAALFMGVTHSEIECLSLNMYHEARNQGTAGVLAVSNVVFMAQGWWYDTS